MRARQSIDELEGRAVAQRHAGHQVGEILIRLHRRGHCQDPG